MHRALLLLAVCLLSGCATQSGKPAVAAKAGAKEIQSLQGPGGGIAIGETLDQAKKAFPPPKDARIFEQSLSFAIFGGDGWAWSHDDMEAFEVALKDGKIIALARTTKMDATEPGKTIAALGEPDRKAESENGAMYVWDAGDNVRFWIAMKFKGGVIPPGQISVVGGKKDLQLLNYRHDDPSAFVAQLDSVAKQMNDPKLKQAFEDAKRKAKQQPQDPR